MTIKGSDYTFAQRTGNINLEFGEAYDCNGMVHLNPHCPHFGNAIINTRGTGIILDPNVRLKFHNEIYYFHTLIINSDVY
jgi:hypothetical protein